MIAYYNFIIELNDVIYVQDLLVDTLMLILADAADLKWYSRVAFT